MQKIKHIRSIFTAIMLVGALLAPAVAVPVDALTGSSLTLSDPRPSTTSVSYTFNASNFTTGTTVRCIDLVLNDQSDGAGTPAATTGSFTLDGSSLITAGSWTEDTGTNGTLRITNSTGETPASSGNIVFGGITNAASEGVTYYGIFTSYTDVNCTGGNEVDQVTVSYALKSGTQVQLTVDPTLIFSCAGVNSGQTVNGATTTVNSSASGIDFQNSVTTAANGISAHDLSVTTNATNGYTVYIRETGQLSNGSDNIADFSGSNGTPAVFSSAGTEGWGYTTEDNSLSGGTTDRFTNPGNYWAGFSTTNDPVMDNTSAATSTETVRVGHQVGIAGTTPAGTYQTTIVYTVASVY